MNVLTSVATLRYPPRELSDRQGMQVRRRAGLLGSLLWLPLAFTAAGASVAGDVPRLTGLDESLFAAGLAAGGVPLVWVCGRLRRMGYGGGAYLAFGVLAPATAAVSVYMTPHGALWVAACAAATSLPAWLACGLGYLDRRARRRNSRRFAR